MMTKFKIGDKVRCIEGNEGSEKGEGWEFNREFTIAEITGSENGVFEPFLKLVESGPSKKYEWKKGDRLEIIKSNSGGRLKIGDIVTVDEDVCTNNDTYFTRIIFKNGEREDFFTKRFKKVRSNINKQEETMGKIKQIINVLAVNKKTGEIAKDVSVAASNEQQAILKAFDVDVENLEIKTTVRSDYTEEKPQTVVLEKDKNKKE